MSKKDIQENGWYVFAWDFMGLSQITAKDTTTFSFENDLNGQNHSYTDFHHPMKKELLSSKFPFPRWEGRLLPYPYNAIWQKLECFIYQSRGVEIISSYSSVWLSTVTQFNTSKNERSLKVLFVIGNRFLMPTWKYWIWISKNERILRTNKCKPMT